MYEEKRTDGLKVQIKKKNKKREEKQIKEKDIQR